MKICICTTPIRPVPTTYPPFGSTAIIQSLRQIGEDPHFFNIDYFRYSHADVEAHFRDNRYDVVGISAVVSTAYAYTKYLALLIRRVSPGTTIIVGGNLAASAEILLRKAGVDLCVIGDGERIIQELITALRTPPLEPSRLGAIKGICFLDRDGKFRFTGYGQRPAADEIASPDYSILENDGSISYFIPDTFSYRAYGSHPFRSEGKKGTHMATVVMAKGCVARCTFCHRFEKGYRPRPVEKLVEHMRLLKVKYNVGFIDIADENFGSDREQARELASALHELGMAWRAAGVRVRTVTLEALKHWKACGCIAVEYGIESGSPKILRVMEKNATLQENINALRFTHEAGLGTVIQLVLGMPGETDETIAETIQFLKDVHPYMTKTWNETGFPSDGISINYAQALPGTPLYEYARENGYIGKTVDEEEQYLIRISDTDAYKEDHFINYTGQPLLKVLMWRPLMLSELDAYHLVKLRGEVRLSLAQLFRFYTGVIAYRVKQRPERVPRWVGVIFEYLAAGDNFINANESKTNYYAESGYFNIQSGLKYAPLKFNPLTRRFFYPIVAFAVAIRNGQTLGRKIALLAGHVAWSLRESLAPHKLQLPGSSLRKVVVTVTRRNEDAMDRMMPLRSGR